MRRGRKRCSTVTKVLNSDWPFQIIKLLETFPFPSFVYIETDKMTAEASKIGTDAPKTPEKIASDDDGESPFRTLRQELGLSRIVTPALRPRRNTDPFVFRLRPDIVRNEVNLQAAINEIIYNEDRVQTFMRLSLTPAEATSVRDLQAAQVLAQFTDETLTLRDALWYLEYANWDVELAILQQMHDHIDRNEAPKAGSVSSKLMETAGVLKADSNSRIRYKSSLISPRRIQISTEILR